MQLFYRKRFFKNLCTAYFFILLLHILSLSVCFSDTNDVKKNKLEGVIEEFNVLIISSGDPEKSDMITMFVAETLSRKKNINIIDINDVPYHRTVVKRRNDRIDIEKYSKMLQNIETDTPVPHIIVLANIETISKMALKYYDRSESLYTASVSLEAIFTKNHQVISKPFVKHVKFTELNIYENVKAVVQPIAKSLSNKIGKFIKSHKKENRVLELE